MSEKKVYITTKDNPYNPDSEFDMWYLWDVTRGYNTCAYLARITHTTDGLTDEENAEEIESAIDDIIRLDPFGMYKKVVVNGSESTD